ncbi:uncharacterized protein [Amphiura filiformis]|uniref:uncharacterized protein n=1 Tax=Amphiura filiformis TaxID=82378 RepID=UPI003B22683E
MRGEERRGEERRGEARRGEARRAEQRRGEARREFLLGDADDNAEDANYDNDADDAADDDSDADAADYDADDADYDADDADDDFKAKHDYTVDPRADGTLDVHFQNVNFKCSHCDAFFPNTKLFTEHVGKVHLGVVSNVCHKSGETFEDDSLLRSHERTHISSNSTHTPLDSKHDECKLSDSFKCVSCGISCASETSLRKHATECQGTNCDKQQTESEQPKDHGRTSGKNFKEASIISNQYNDKDQRNCITTGHESTKSKPSSDDATGTASTIVKKEPTVFTENRNDTDPVSSESTVGGVQFQFICISCKRSFSNPNRLIRHHTKMHMNEVETGTQGGTKTKKSSKNKKQVSTAFTEQKGNNSSSPNCSSKSDNQIHKIKMGEASSSKQQKGILPKDKGVVSKKRDVVSKEKGVVSKESGVLPMKRGVVSKERSVVSKETGVVSKERSVVSIETGVVSNERQRQCPVCKEWFQDEATMEIHKDSHTTDKPYPCEQCQKSFTDLTKLIEHIKKDKTHPKPNNCPICDKFLKSSSSIPEHVISHYKIQPYSCTRCDKRFSAKTTLRAHMAWHDGKYKCDECGQHCQSKYILKLHKESHNDAKRKEKVTFNVQSTSISDNRIHTATTEEACAAHQRKTSMDTMKILQISHTSDKPYPCEPCHKSFTDLTKLIEHIKEDKTHQNPHNCHICDKVFKSSSSIPEHVISHFGRQPYSCTKCDKLFSFRTTLRAHMAWHDGRYKCDECGKHCQSKYILKLHKRKHSDIVLYTCQLCATGFKHEKSFKKHICLDKDKGGTRNEEAPKPFVCAHCGSSYRRRYALLVHERRNHGPTPPERFPCEHCDKSYLDKKTLKNHIMAVHSDNGNPFACLCVACGKTYVSKECLKIHEMAVHSTVKPFQCTTCKQRFWR